MCIDKGYRLDPKPFLIDFDVQHIKTNGTNYNISLIKLY
jgi:hypothetical protein